MIMSYASSSGVFALATVLMTGGAQAADGAKYPNWHGQWDTVSPRLGGQSIKFDPYKPFGPAQEAPLTPEYKKIHEESMADQAKGGQFSRPLQMHPGRHAEHDVDPHDRIHHHAGDHLYRHRQQRPASYLH
jgi:hypothetical protein